MVEFLDRTSLLTGTPINRANLMAIQGFVAKTTEFVDGKIVEMNGKNEILTTEFGENDNGESIIIETFKGVKTIVKTTTFKSDGTIEEALS